MALFSPRNIALVLTATAGFAASPFHAARAGLEIDHIDATNFVEKNELVFFVDIINDTTGLVVRDQDEKGAGISISIDDQPVTGTFKVETFKDASQLLSVSALMAAHYDFADEFSDTYPKSAVDEITTGFKTFFQNLSDQDRVSAWFYTESTRKPTQVASWGRPMQVPGAIDSIVQGAKEQTPTKPSLYGHIATVLESFAEDAEQPRRKILVVVSDGSDILANDPNRGELLKKKIDEIVERATTIGVKIYAVGFVMATDPDSERRLINLQSLASRTGGVYRRATKDVQGDKVNLGIADTLSGLASELHNQYVITFKPEEYRGSEKPVDIQMDVATTTGNLKFSRKKEKVKIGERPTDWGAILMLVGIVLGSLLGVFLIFLLIRKIIRSRANRPQAVAVQEEFVGPYKGRLMATAGVYAGQEFYITEDVTTIGSLAGNTIVLTEGGVSKRHAGIKVEDMRFELADFGSTNGTFVNGAKVTKQFLKDGDEIRLGDNKLRFTLK